MCEGTDGLSSRSSVEGWRQGAGRGVEETVGDEKQHQGIYCEQNEGKHSRGWAVAGNSVNTLGNISGRQGGFFKKR